MLLYLHEDKKSFHVNGFTQPRFDTKALGNSEMAYSKLINPLCPNSVQNQFSPNNIHRLSSAKSMRINKMITKRKIFDLLSNSLN